MIYHASYGVAIQVLKKIMNRSKHPRRSAYPVQENQSLLSTVILWNGAKIFLNALVQIKAHGLRISDPEATHFVPLAGNPLNSGDGAQRVKQIPIGDCNDTFLFSLGLRKLESFQGQGLLSVLVCTALICPRHPRAVGNHQAAVSCAAPWDLNPSEDRSELPPLREEAVAGQKYR